MNAIFPGSFDPFTVGHCDIVKRAARLFDKVIVAVAGDTGKQTAPLPVRVELTRASLEDIPNVAVLGFCGLTTDFAAQNDCGVILRGVRGVSDFAYEQQLYREYKRLAAKQNTDIEIVYLLSALNHVSSTEVRRLVSEGADISGYVSGNILERVTDIYKGL